MPFCIRHSIGAQGAGLHLKLLHCICMFWVFVEQVSIVGAYSQRRLLARQHCRQVCRLTSKGVQTPLIALVPPVGAGIGMSKTAAVACGGLYPQTRMGTGGQRRSVCFSGSWGHQLFGWQHTGIFAPPTKPINGGGQQPDSLW